MKQTKPKSKDHHVNRNFKHLLFKGFKVDLQIQLQKEQKFNMHKIVLIG